MRCATASRWRGLPVDHRHREPVQPVRVWTRASALFLHEVEKVATVELANHAASVP